VDFESDNQMGMHSVLLQIGEELYPVFVTTSEYGIGMISSQCGEPYFIIPKKYDSESSPTYVSSSLDREHTEPVALFDDIFQNLKELSFDGQLSQEEFKFNLNYYYR